MSDARTDANDAPDPLDSTRPLKPEEALQAAGSNPGLPMASGDAESPEFDLGPSSAPTDDTPTIITRANRKQPRPEDMTKSLRGRTLAHFDLLEPVGVGGMAAVIRARDQQLDRTVALKILPPAMATDPESIRRFNHEAKAAAKLDHENIARVFYCGEDQGLHFIAFEFVEGDNLRVILDQRGPLPVAESIKYMLQVAAGLAHASTRGVVHRDIKPSNIIITPTGRAKLVDMGLARSLEKQSDGELTQSGVTLGTFDYISPEQALEPREADVRSDIYSLGCTFYHMLTGQPPVPEGTAAKKLHHHQHLAPVDPRQLNPAIPDEAAAILARMMAKNPKERYQRPEHLVQHLLQLAQKLGDSGDVPEGVMFVDAPLPSAPRARPLVVVGVAAAVLLAVVLLIGALPGAGAPPEYRPVDIIAGPGEPPPNAGDKTTSGDTENPPRRVEDPPVVPSERRRIVVATSQALADALKHPSVHVLLSEDQYDLKHKRDDSGGEAPGLVFQGKDLVLEALDPARRPTIYLGYDASGKFQSWNALTVGGGTVVLRNLRLVIHAAGTPTPMTAVSREAGRIRFENCEFQQTGMPDESLKAQLCSVAASGRTGDAFDGEPDLLFEHCWFRGGDQALLCTGATVVHMKDCAFGPHRSLVQFRGSRVQDAELWMQLCSAMLENTTVFSVGDDAECRIVVGNSLFADASAGVAEDQPGCVLIRQSAERPGKLRFESDQRNVYHRLTSYWLQGNRVRAGTLDELRLETQLGRTDRSVALTVNPWQLEQPLSWLSQPRKAFQLNMEAPELRRLDNPKRMIGVEAAVWGPLYPAELPPVKERRPDPLVRKEKIVEPGRSDSNQGVYSTLKEAVAAASPGDVILIKHDGPEPLYVGPLRLDDNPELDLTIKAFEGCHPILFLGKTNDPDAAMFRVSDGKLTLENLELHLPTPRAEFRAQSLIFITGDAVCTLKKCIVTIEDTKDVPFSVFTLADPNTMMRKEPKPGGPTGGPRLRLEQCFVRGEGDLLSVRGSQAFSLDVDESLIALDGSLAIVDGNAKEPPTKPAAQINLNRATVYLTEHLFLLRACEAKPMPGLVPTQVLQVANCVFVSGREKNALVHLDGMDNDDQLKRLFSWGDGKQNVYSGFSPMLEQRPRPDNATPLSQYDRGKWEDFTPRETDRRYDKVTFSAWPGAEQRPLSRSWGSQFRIKAPLELIGWGANTERLPRSREEMDSGMEARQGE
ncbi:MAG: serine/threonine protein kinase [Planctomycetia bacterium]|nr:serine/threonine protein kinase [Planctomycetia bacterium]